MLTVFMILLAVIGQSGDVLTTVAGLRTGHRELNRVTEYVYSHYSIAGLVALKVIYIVLAVAVGKIGLLIAALIGIGLTINNVIQLRKSGYFSE